MKKNIFNLVSILCLFSQLSAQYTKGGSKKNYERYNVSYDSIVTETKVPLEGFTEHISFNLSYAKATDDNTRAQMSEAEYMNNPYYAAPLSTGKIGLTGGFSFGLDGIAPINAINKNLIPNIDLGINYNFGATFLKYNWKEMFNTNPSSVYYDLFNDATYHSFNIIHFGMGPSVTFIPFPSEPKFAVDVFGRLNANLVIIPDFSSDYSSSDYSYTVDLETNSEGTRFEISPTIGFNLRFKTMKIFVEKNMNITAQSKSNSIQITESLDAWDVSVGSSYANNQFALSRFINLSNIQFGIGLIFPD